MKNRLTAISAFLLLSLTFTHAEEITFKAESMSGTAGNNNSKTILKGSANVVTETMEINADSIELSGKNYRQIKATGNITGVNKESKLEFTCGSLTYDRENKIAVLSDNVILKDTENEVTAKAQTIEYNQNTDVAIMQINVNLVQKNNICTGAFAIYKKEEQSLELSGNPQIIQDKDTFRAQTISLNLKTQEISLTGRVKGSVSTTTNDENSKEPKNPPGPAEKKE